MDCARVMRGTSSSARAETRRAASAWTISALCPGLSSEMSVEPSASRPISWASGGWTFAITGAAANAAAASGTIVAPTAW